MYVLSGLALTAAAITLSAGLTGCSSAADTADLKVGDCLKVGGTADRPTATVAACGSPASNFKVVATVTDRERCPADVDSSY
ncbi:MAG: LppU/SCO3897 family protein, partial [Mycobacterium sp.]